MKITVILTSYNHGRYLTQSIESVLNQTYQDYEFIIVDDFSDDASWEIICEYKKRNPKIINIRHKYNWGSGSVQDVVINYATGDYIAIHHSDDIWDKDKLQKQVDAIKKIPNCAAVFTNATAIDETGKEYLDKEGFYYNLFSVKNRSRHEWLNYFFYKGNCLCHPSILIRKDVYMEDGFFRKGLRQIPDFVKWIQVCKKYEIYVLSEPLVKFRVHNAGKNTSGMRADTQIRSTVELFLMLNEYADIKERGELLKIFPEAEKYCSETFFSPEYVFGRICTEEGMPSYTRLFGNQLLYRVLNNFEMANKIKREYHYDYRDYIKENGMYDIFGILPSAFEQRRTLYVNRGKGYCSEDCIVEKFVLRDKEVFEMNCRLSFGIDEKLLGLRFDPAEGVMIRAQLIKVTLNGIELEYMGENALFHENGLDIFVNLDPIYNIKIPEIIDDQYNMEIVITGQIERLTEDEIDKVVTTVMYEKREALNSLQVYESECKRMSEELEAIKRTKLYRVVNKFNSKSSK